jgi:Trk K+ transport system NAD-binding subunit
LTLDQLEWAKRQDVTIVGVIREGERMPPNGSMKLHPGDARRLCAHRSKRLLSAAFIFR